MAYQYDKIIKENLSDLAPHFISLITGKEYIFEEQLQDELNITLGSRPDFVHKIRTSKGEKAVLHIEFQGYQEKDFTKRMHLYHAMLYQKYSFNIYQYAIVIGDTAFDVVPSFEHPEGWHYKYNLLYLRDLDYKLFLCSPNPQEVVFAAFANIPAQLRSETVERIIQKLRYLVRGDMKALAKYFRQLDALSPLNQALAPHINKSIEAMIETMTKEQAETVRKHSYFYKEGMQKGMQQGMQQGMEKGMRQGMQQEKKETARKMLLDGLPIDTVAKYTGLTLKEVEEIKSGL